MKIKKLYLLNFKSYKEETINFDEGINCILGNNGAGKSTIIEAIGYAMFNYRKNIKDKLIRYGENKAKIELDYEANDGVIYTIIRIISTANDTVRIINQNTKEVIEDAGNVYPFIAKTLGIKQDRNITTLFEEIIAVPQGDFVSLFLLTDSKRKLEFESLFNLKIYDDISTTIGQIISKNKENKYSSETELEGLKGQTKDIEEIRKDEKELESKIQLLINQISDDIKTRNDLEKSNKSDEETKKKIDDLQEEINSLKNKKTELNTKLESCKNNKVEIDKAVKIINDVKNDYDKYIELDSKIKTEEKKEEKYNNDSEELNNKKLALNDLENIEKTNNKIITSAEFRINGISLNLVEDESQKIKINNELNDAKIKYNNCKKTQDDLENKVNELNAKKSNFEQLLNNYELSYKSVEKYSNINLESELNIYEQLIKDDAEKERLIKELEEIKNKINLINFSIENIQKNMEELSKGNCPILNKKCLTLGTEGNGDLLSLLAQKNKDLDELNKLEKTLKSSLNLYNDIDKSKLTNSQNINNANEYNKTVNEIKKQVKNDFENISVDDMKLKEIFEEIDKIINQIKVNISKENSALESAKKDVEEKQKTVSDINSKLIKIETIINQKNEEITTAKKEIKTAEDAIKVNDEAKKKSQEEIAKFIIEMQENSTAKAQKELYQNQQNNLKENYEKYIQNKVTAEKQESNLIELNTCDLELKKVAKNLDDKTKDLTDISNNFDNNKYEENKASFNKVDALITANNKALKESKETLKKTTDKLVEKEKLLKQISGIEKQIIKYNNVENYLTNARSILKNLPMELSKQYRKNISSMATIHYQRISKENVTIEIDDTYRVNVIDNCKKTNVKDMTQLSGGEQMSLAISIRISMLKYFAGIDMYFLDEPTVNLDKERRFEIAEVIKDCSKELKQLFVISHDDTFESITTNILKLEKINNESELSIE